MGVPPIRINWLILNVTHLEVSEVYVLVWQYFFFNRGSGWGWGPLKWFLADVIMVVVLMKFSFQWPA